MKKRNKTLNITIDNLPNGLENGSIAGSTSSITSLVGISIGFRRRKNFSLILLAGLSALLCALYYTSYYPGAVWTLRLGVTSFTNQGPGGGSDSAASASTDGKPGESGVGENRLENFSPYAGDGTNVGGSDISNSRMISNKSGTGTATPGVETSNRQDGNGAGEENADEISTPETWNWKYWASLEYWKVNFTLDEEESFVGKLKENTAGGGSGSLSDSSAAAPTTTSSSSSEAKATDEFSSNLIKMDSYRGTLRAERLTCNFPRLNPFDPSITDFIKNPPAIDCSKSYPLVFTTNFRNKLIQQGQPFPDGEDTRNNMSCCYKTITRGNGSDHNVIFSKRCYPIVKPETEIPATHEFISVRCRPVGRGSGGSSSGTRKYPGPFENETNPMNKTNGTTANNGNHNNSHNSTSTTPSSINSKVYKDMMAFVPLKPWVEDRIRKYEESKRKSLYVHKKARQSSQTGDDGKDEIGSQRKDAQKGIHLSGNDGNYEHHLGMASPETKFHSGRATGNDDDMSQAKIETTNEDRLSLLILGLDAQSHMNFIRQMPLTYTFLTKNLSGIGMQGYTKIGDNTFPNVVSLLSGLSVDELEKVCWPTKQSYFDSCPFIWKKFADVGYRTSLAEDSVWMGTFNYEKKGFLRPPTDYYLHPLSLLMAKKIGHETWANAKICYGPRFAFEVLLDYMIKTAVTFRNSLYFQFVWANSLFHDYLNNPRLGDELLVSKLEFLEANGFFNNTAFILLSDHGIRWGSIRSTYQGKIEERMPLAYFAFPAWFRRKYAKGMRNLRKNVLRLTTPYDVYETLKDILRLSQGKNIRFDRWKDEEDNDDNQSDTSGSTNGGKSKTRGRSESDEEPPRGISLFRPIPMQRTCKMAGIEEHWCVCHSMESVPINSTLVQSGARFIVQVINGLVRKHSGFCAKLSLFKINEAKRKIDGDIDRGLDVDFFFTSGSAHKMNGVPSAPDGTRADGNPFNGENWIANKMDSAGKITSSKTHKYETDKVGKVRDKMRPKENEWKGGWQPSVKIFSTREENDMMTSLSTTSDIKKMIQLQITLVTRPGDAVFEATIHGEAEPPNDQYIDQEAGRRSSHHWKLSGDISRLNLYGSQSACVKDYTVQKYCYCHNLRID